MYLYKDVWLPNIDTIRNKFKKNLNGGQNKSADQKKEAEARFEATVKRSTEFLHEDMMAKLKKLPALITVVNAYELPKYGSNAQEAAEDPEAISVTNNAVIFSR